MSVFKIKLRLSDRLWTQYLRIRQKFTCQKCGRVYTEDTARNLGVAHYHNRSHENVRFDEENTLLLCNLPCHRYLDQHRSEFDDFMKKRLGQKRWDLLNLRAHIYKKRDDKADAMIIRQLLKGQEQE